MELPPVTEPNAYREGLLNPVLARQRADAIHYEAAAKMLEAAAQQPGCRHSWNGCFVKNGSSTLRPAPPYSIPPAPRAEID